MQAIAFPDIEGLLVSHLVSELSAFGASATAHGSVPNPRPAEFVVVRRVGGPRRDVAVDQPTLVFECYAATPAGAFALAIKARAIVNALPGALLGGHQVYTVTEVAGPGLLPDPNTDQARYTFTTALAVRGSVLDRED